MTQLRALLSPCPPATHYLPLSEAVAVALGRRSRVLLLVVLIWWLSLGLQADGLLDDAMFLLTGNITTMVWVLNVIWVIWLLRRAIGLTGDEYVPGLGWLRLFVNLALWIGVALLVLRVWGASDFTADIMRYFTEGFPVAGLTIVPSQLLWAIVVLAVLLTLTRWLKGRLNSKWLVQTRMERSAREALVTTFGYVAVALAVIVALSIAGIKFTNLAIIAGALSVGIGFGLQNVVNNFVSGIIMLVERPVRNGDWIVAGSTEGHVQRISIRTTTIRTFDRAEVIVPNSGLISGQVTNWTLRNGWGRIKVPIGVAYGSDTAKVKETLLEIASNNASVIKGNPQLSDPNVLFLGFGDSALN